MSTADYLTAQETLTRHEGEGPGFDTTYQAEQVRRLRQLADELEAGQPVAFALAVVRDGRPGTWSSAVRAFGTQAHAEASAQLHSLTAQLVGLLAADATTARLAWRAEEIDAGRVEP